MNNIILLAAILQLLTLTTGCRSATFPVWITEISGLDVDGGKLPGDMIEALSANNTSGWPVKVNGSSFSDELVIQHTGPVDKWISANEGTHGFIIKHSRFTIDPKTGDDDEQVFSKTYFAQINQKHSSIQLDDIKLRFEKWSGRRYGKTLSATPYPKTMSSNKGAHGPTGPEHGK